MNNLGNTLHEQGKYEEAEQIRRWTPNLKRVRGEKHPEALKSMNNRASTLQKQGKHDEAE